MTGNSAHYLLDESGRPLDVLPGLYSPKHFSSWLERGVELAARYRKGLSFEAGDAGQSSDEVLQSFHSGRKKAIQNDWRNDIQLVAPELLKKGLAGYARKEGSNPNGLIYIDAIQAGKLTQAKLVPELPILQAIKAGPQETDRMVTDKLWLRIAELHRPDVKLDRNSVALMRRLNPGASLAGRLAATKRVVEDPLLRVVRKFEDSIALDTVRNEYLLHRQVHRWYVDGTVPVDLDSLNERVYAELFLTPSSDPWLGLAPIDAFTALDNEGKKSPIIDVITSKR